ncbi:SMR family transporter [Bacillus sp. P14.5]|uniref:DMT family transporter n=1 Tax=Bacillus sp. P14.5 TaxID=1983400 RepID=UPI001F0518F9|nr:SMR family transporter [Bacillus sp. P14.5]
MSRSLETLPLGLAYSIWVGIGAAGGVVLGMLYLNESRDRWRIFFLLLIIGSVIGLKVVA